MRCGLSASGLFRFAGIIPVPNKYDKKEKDPYGKKDRQTEKKYSAAGFGQTREKNYQEKDC